jgi:hypothetical protein
MSVGQRTTIGFDRRIDVEWLDAAAGRIASGHSPADVREFLWGLLDGVVSGHTVHSARGKTLTVLMRIWVTVPSVAEPLRNAAIKRINLASAEERLALHWAMSVACYPIFADVAAHAGKLLALHGQASLSQIVRRMTETWGDRSTLPRAVQRVLRSMVQWGALREGKSKGVFLSPLRPIVLSEGLAELVVQAILVSHGHGMGLAQATSHSALFPFEARVNASSARKSDQIRVLRQGDQTDFVELAVRKA